MNIVVCVQYITCDYMITCFTVVIDQSSAVVYNLYKLDVEEPCILLLEIDLICLWTCLEVQLQFSNFVGNWIDLLLNIPSRTLHIWFFDENLFNLPSNLPWNSIWSWHLLGEQILPKKLHVSSKWNFYWGMPVTILVSMNLP